MSEEEATIVLDGVTPAWSEPEPAAVIGTTKKKSTKKKAEPAAIVAATAAGLTKAAILANKKWRANKDMLSAILVNGKRYSEREINEIINKFLRRTY